MCVFVCVCVCTCFYLCLYLCGVFARVCVSNVVACKIIAPRYLRTSTLGLCVLVMVCTTIISCSVLVCCDMHIDVVLIVGVASCLSYSALNCFYISHQQFGMSSSVE